MVLKQAYSITYKTYFRLPSTDFTTLAASAVPATAPTLSYVAIRLSAISCTIAVGSGLRERCVPSIAS